MFSKKFMFLKGSSRLLNITQLQTMDYVYKAQPFVYVVTKSQETNNLDLAFDAKPFVGAK